MKFGIDQIGAETPKPVRIGLHIAMIVTAMLALWVNSTSLIGGLIKDETNIALAVIDIALIGIAQLFGKAQTTQS